MAFVLMFLGAVALVIGVGFWSIPAAIIIAGVLLTVAGWDLNQ